MSDVTRRISRWKAKYSPEIAAQTTARIIADMTERYEASVVALTTMETETKQVLSASGIDTMYIVFYLDFARQLFRLSHGRSISGPTLAREAQVLLEKWAARGGDTSATRSSRRSVDVSPSASPCRHPLRGLQRPRAGAVAAGCR
jgi:acyl-CoA reductase-like NAD-dependent aldehyde dehydrogenase